MCVYSVPLVFSCLTRDDGLVGNECNNIEVEVIRRGGRAKLVRLGWRLPEWLIAREETNLRLAITHERAAQCSCQTVSFR